MIKKIKNIHYKCFDNYNANLELDKINIFWGYNGKGKSSLAKFIKEKIDNNELDCFECDNQEYRAFLYNEEYKNDVLYSQDGFKTFYTGSEIKKILKEKEMINNRIENCLKNRISILTKYKNKIEKEISELKTKIAKDTRDCLIQIDTDFKNSQSYKANKIYFNPVYKIIDDNVDKYLKYKKDGTPETILNLKVKYIKENLLTPIDDVLKQTPQNNAIGKLKQNHKIENLAKLAIEIKNKDEKYQSECPLCGAKISENFWNDLQSHFDKAYEEFLKKLNEKQSFLKNNFLKECEEIIKFLNKNLINSKILDCENLDEIRNNNINILEKIKNKINNFIKFLNEKEKNLNKIDFELNLGEFNVLLSNVQIDYINKIINSHNQKAKDYTKIVDNNIQKIKEHFIAKKYKEFMKLDKNIQRCEDSIKIIEELIRHKEKELKKYDKKIEEIDKSIENLDNGLGFFGINDEIKFRKNENSSYEIYRKDCNRNFIKGDGLSEGEKTIVSIIYFLNYIEYIYEKENLEFIIILIDDPITSLDYENKDAVINFIINKLNNLNAQILLFSHDEYVLYDYNKKLHKQNKKYKVIKNSYKSNIDHLKEIPHSDIKKYYQDLKDFIQSSNYSEHQINNAKNLARKFIEKIFAILFENSTKMTICYNKLFEKYGINNKTYEAIDIHKFAHGSSDEKTEVEVKNKIRFIIEEIYEKHIIIK